MGNIDDKSTCTEMLDHEREILIKILDKAISYIEGKRSFESQYRMAILGIESVYHSAITTSVMLLSAAITMLAAQIKIYSYIKIYENIFFTLSYISMAVAMTLIAIYIMYEISCLKRSKNEIKKNYDKQIETYSTTIKRLSSIYEAISRKYQLAKLCSPDKELLNYIGELIKLIGSREEIY